MSELIRAPFDGASYTMTLRDVCNRYDIGLGPNDYPIFDEGYRLPLNRKIRDHFWLREIGQETPEMFRFMLNRKMREIMPPLNELYLSARIKYDPLNTYSISTIASGTASNEDENTSTAAATNNGNNSSRVAAQEFPQMRLADDGDYATSATDTTSATTNAQDSTSSSKSTGTNASENRSTTTGRMQSAASLIQEYRATILNLDMEVIDALNPLFMNLWHNGDQRISTATPSIWPGYAFNFGFTY